MMGTELICIDCAESLFGLPYDTLPVSGPAHGPDVIGDLFNSDNIYPVQTIKTTTWDTHKCCECNEDVQTVQALYSVGDLEKEASNCLRDMATMEHAKEQHENLTKELGILDKYTILPETKGKNKKSMGKSKNKNKNKNTTFIDPLAYQNDSYSSYNNDYGDPLTKTQTSFFTGSRKSCPVHTGMVTVWDNGQGSSLAGAQGSEVFVDRELNLVIDLAGMFKGNKDKSPIIFTQGDTVPILKPVYQTAKQTNLQGDEWTAKMSRLKRHVRTPPVLRIHNPDMGIPPVGFEFWKELYALLPLGRTVCCCVGGHGRTGTALAALILAGDPERSWEEAAEIVRENHCSNAIESDLQETYLKALEDERNTGKGN